jgi:hexosaminidase
MKAGRGVVAPPAVTFGPVVNGSDGTSFRAHLTLANRNGRCALGASGWRLYFSSARQPLAVDPDGDAARADLAAQGVTIRRGDAAQSGDLYVLEPTSGFRPLGPGERRTLEIGFELSAILATDAPAGWHVVFGDGPARWVPARVRLDASETTAATTRFAENTAPRLRLSLGDRILPRPLRARAARGSFALSRSVEIDAPAELGGEAGYLRSALGDILAGGAEAGGRIDLALDRGLDAEGYTLDVSPPAIRIAGADPAGVLHGIQTLRQLIPADAYRDAARGRPRRTVAVPCAHLDDAPLFGYRGLQIDVARHFESKATIEKFLDLMSFLKLNRLHLHLTDDEGWRLEIPGLPELTGFGSRRGHDPAEATMLHQGMGSGSDLSGADGVEGKAADATEANLGRPPRWQGFEQATVNYVGQGTGHYSPAEFEEILRYAAARHIAVIPELDFPAHARAAVQAMERRHRRLADSDPEEAERYRLLDPGDTSHHVSVQHYTDDLANPCLESTYRFLDKVVTEVAAMYRAAGAPLEMVNLGGDEAPGPDRWQHSPAREANPATAGRSDRELMDLFYERWNEIALRVAPRTAGWEDILLDGTGRLRLRDFVALPWQNLPGGGREHVAYRLANEGIPVILAHATNLYLDLAYDEDPEEPGQDWAGFVDERSTFTYQPFDERLTPEGRRNILGLEAQLWGENGKSPQIREYQAFPKLLGAAERAWNRDTPAAAQMPDAWDVFCNTLGQATFPLLSWYRPVNLPRSQAGVNYRIPLPGGRIRDGVLEANVRNPGLDIEYARDGRSWHRYTRPVRVGDTAFLRTRAPDGRTSRVARVA